MTDYIVHIKPAIETLIALEVRGGKKRKKGRKKRRKGQKIEVWWAKKGKCEAKKQDFVENILGRF